MLGRNICAFVAAHWRTIIRASVVVALSVGVSALSSPAFATPPDNAASTELSYTKRAETFTVHLLVGEHGSVEVFSAESEPRRYGAQPEHHALTVDAGERLTYCAIPETGYGVGQVVHDGDPVEPNADGCYVAPAVDHDVVVSFSFVSEPAGLGSTGAAVLGAAAAALLCTGAALVARRARASAR